jgi:Ankyrin repeats (many copies)
MGFDPNSASADGTTAFHYAVWQGHLRLAKYLLRIGADVNALNSFGCNAIQWAAQSDHLEVCRWLSMIGLDLAIINDNGHSAIHKAALKGQDRICAWLLNEEALGLAHMGPDLDGHTPAALARMDGHAVIAAKLDACAQRLLDAGPALSEHGPYGDDCGRLHCGGHEAGQAAYRIQKGSSPEYRSRCVRAARLQQVSLPCGPVSCR